MLWLRYSIARNITSKIQFTNFRYLYGVHHDPGVFYVRLPKDGTNGMLKLLNKTLTIITWILLGCSLALKAINLCKHNFTTKDRAVLLYRQTDTVLDMYAVEVPKKYGGKGLGRLLAEAAFTYVIVRNYRMYLTCTYLQRYYQKIKTQHLSVYVLGPPNILGGPYPVSMFPTMEADKLEGMPDPSDTDNMFNKE